VRPLRVGFFRTLSSVFAHIFAGIYAPTILISLDPEVTLTFAVCQTEAETARRLNQ
jgi:hypothetical protein